MLPENSRSGIVDLQSQKDSTRNRSKNYFLLNAQILHF